MAGFKGSRGDLYAWDTGPFTSVPRPVTGVPGRPLATTSVGIQLSWKLSVPTAGTPGDVDFSATYPSEAYNITGTDYLELMRWTAPVSTPPASPGVNAGLLLLTSVVVLRGTNYVGSSAPHGLAGTTFDFYVYSSKQDRSQVSAPLFFVNGVAGDTVGDDVLTTLAQFGAPVILGGIAASSYNGISFRMESSAGLISSGDIRVIINAQEF